jgi:hypothetical protein
MPQSVHLIIFTTVQMVHLAVLKKKIDFKIAVYTFKLLARNQPTYLCNLLTLGESNRSSRSAYQNYLYLPRTKTEFWAWAFSSTAPKVWNSLPLDLRLSPSIESLKRIISHLFKGVRLPPGDRPHL